MYHELKQSINISNDIIHSVTGPICVLVVVPSVYRARMLILLSHTARWKEALIKDPIWSQISEACLRPRSSQDQGPRHTGRAIMVTI